MRVHNVHERLLAAPPERVGALLETLGGADDRLWPVAPHGRWPPLQLERGLEPGSRGGHGPIRYQVLAHDPAERVVFGFEPEGLSRGIVGTHLFELEGAPEGTVLRHVIEAQAAGRAAWRWRLLLAPLHDLLMEDALDRAELAFTACLARPGPPTLRQRLLVRALGHRLAAYDPR